MTVTKTKKVPREVKAKVSVSEGNVRKTSMRLLSSALVSTEIQYVQRELGARATQSDLDAQVLAVRALPWAQIVVPD